MLLPRARRGRGSFLSFHKAHKFLHNLFSSQDALEPGGKWGMNSLWVFPASARTNPGAEGGGGDLFFPA